MKGSRITIIVLSILALSAVLGLVNDPLPRVFLGVLVIGFLIWSAGRSVETVTTVGPPPGARKRTNHALRHRVDEFLKNVRRLHAIGLDSAAGHVPKPTGERAFEEIERVLHNLVGEIRQTAGQGAAQPVGPRS
jgi:hypothetical protein